MWKGFSGITYSSLSGLASGGEEEERDLIKDLKRHGRVSQVPAKMIAGSLQDDRGSCLIWPHVLILPNDIVILILPT
jgi:hypothetical protein